MEIGSEEFDFPPWTITVTKSHILPSQCTTRERCVRGDTCDFCVYMSTLALPHLPEMVFPRNVFRLQHVNEFFIEFNALDALKQVIVGDMPLKVACSEDWKNSRMATGYTDNAIHPFDWTYTTEYCGTLYGKYRVESEVEQRIDIKKLKVQEEILFYKEIILFEDELHDNGVALSAVKFRVMPTGYFLLYRYFLRVDGVLVRVVDTRYYYETGKPYVLRERSFREAKFNEIDHPSVAVANDPSEYLDLVPIKYLVNDRIFPGE